MEYEQKVRKKVWEIFGNSKKVTTFALAIEREIIDAKDGPFVYRLGRKIFILERGVRFPHGLRKKRLSQNRVEMASFVLFQIEVIWIFLKKRSLQTYFFHSNCFLLV